jgi:tetratricopeptide (TPR) repeat protein
MKIRCSSLLFILVALLITVGCAHNKTIEGFNAIEWFEIGRQASIDNHLDKALNAFNKAIELDPKVAKAYVNRGRVYYYLGNHNQEIADYDKAIKLNPKNIYAYVNRGGAYVKLCNHKQAIADWKIAARLGLKEAQDYLKQQGIAW